eukprot:TRINITY_DN13322_c0_g1_i12.p1 TRINITY_DN13322_c0_g1~~TRINITY_DN13322_c0_g1_i12.p1  ORF type:complete len:465 (-),score=21.84 TRINITY_DN13322_c0_g1_i12:590-1984(-)
MAEVCLTIRNAVTSEHLATLSISEVATVDALLSAARAALRATGSRYTILHQGEPLSAGAKLLSELGFADGMVLEAVIKSLPPCMTQVASMERTYYHCHDTWLAEISTNQNNSALMAWTRRRHTAKSPVKDMEIGEENDSEIVLIDMLQCVPDDWEELIESNPGRSKRRTSWSGYAPEVMVLGGLRARHLLLGIYNSRPLLQRVESDGEETYSNSSRKKRWTDSICLCDESGNVSTVWRRADHSCKLQFAQLWFIGDNFLAFAHATEAEHLQVISGSLVVDVTGAVCLRIQNSKSVDRLAWPNIGFGTPPELTRLKLLGTDPGQQWLWIRTKTGVNLINTVSLEEVSPCWRRVDDTSQFYCVLDGASLDLYLLVDRSEQVYETMLEASCEVYRVRARAESTDKAFPPVSYADPPERICEAFFQIDGFSDSFCISGTAYDRDRDCIIAWDAERGLWAMPLVQARHC